LQFFSPFSAFVPCRFTKIRGVIFSFSFVDEKGATSKKETHHTENVFASPTRTRTDVKTHSGLETQHGEERRQSSIFLSLTHTLHLRVVHSPLIRNLSLSFPRETMFVVPLAIWLPPSLLRTGTTCFSFQVGSMTSSELAETFQEYKKKKAKCQKARGG
jgi:hypothetical protein